MYRITRIMWKWFNREFRRDYRLDFTENYNKAFPVNRVNFNTKVSHLKTAFDNTSSNSYIGRKTDQVEGINKRILKANRKAIDIDFKIQLNNTKQ